MATYAFTWNPTEYSWPEFERDRVAVQNGQPPSFGPRWSTGNRTKIHPDERFFLFRQHTHRGIIGSGITTSDGFRDVGWRDGLSMANYVGVQFDMLLPIDEIMPIERLQELMPTFRWGYLQASGVAIPSSDAERVEQLWRTHLERLGRIAPALPEEIPESTRYIEGAKREITVNAYERDPNARRDCIVHYGCVCVVCGFDFRAFYGQLGDGFIHAHHLRDLAIIGEDYEVNPISDLRPVCPNCHAMLHKERPAMSIERLQEIIRAQRTAMDQQNTARQETKDS